MVRWPRGGAPFAVDELLKRGRALDQATSIGEPTNRAEVREVVDSLSAYVAALPPDQQVEAARCLVAELVRRQRFTPTVLPRTLAVSARPAVRSA